MRTRLALGWMILGLLAGCATISPGPLSPQIGAKIRLELEGKLSREAEPLPSQNAVSRFYHRREFAPAWEEKGKLSNQGTQLIQLIQNATNEGLRPNDYHAATLQLLRGEVEHSPQDEELARMDVLLTDAFLTYAHDLSMGRVKPSVVDDDWHIQRQPTPTVPILESALRTSSVAATLEGLAPQNPEYRALKDGLARLRRSRNASPKLIEQLEVNLERWRWLPRPEASRFILVDIAGYRVQAYDAGRPVFSMRAVMGKNDSATPVFIDRITQIVLNPYWDIPSDIVENELLDKIADDPNYLADHDIEVVDRTEGRTRVIAPETINWAHVSFDHFPYSLRQIPGPDNALGSIKFLFPNRYSIYLHGTSAPELFSKKSRLFSHGCIRVEDPVRLAQFVLSQTGTQNWDVKRLISSLDSLKPQTISLRTPMPIELLYRTVVADPDGTLYFRRDVYGWDRPVEVALKEGTRTLVR